MEVKEIIRKEKLEQSEMEFVIEQYIKEKKGRDVKINIHNNQMIHLIPKEFQQSILQKELQLLNEAYNVACSYYFKKNKEKSSKN